MDGTATDSTTPGMGMPSGAGAHQQNIATRPPLLVRPSGVSYEFGGARYFDYNAAPVRADRLQVMLEPVAIELYARTHTKAGGIAVPTLRSILRVRELWDNAYEQLVYRAESAGSYRHEPASLNVGSVNVKDYCQLYMRAVALLTEITCWQKLAQFDRGHRTVASMQTARVPRSRVNTGWETVTSFPMFKGLHDFAIYAATPVMASPSGIVYHRGFPKEHDSPNLGQTWHYLAMPSASPVAPVNVSYATNLMQDVELIVQVLNMLATGLTDENKANINSIQGLFRMSGLTMNPTRWEDINPLIMDEGLYDQRVQRGAYIGQFVRTGTDDQLCYPRVTGSSARTVNLVEQRGLGAPTQLIVSGMETPWGADYEVVPVASDNIIYGAIQYNTQGQGATPSAQRFFRSAAVYDPDGGWRLINTVPASGDIDGIGEPWKRHQYVHRGGTGGGFEAFRVNDPVDWSFFMPAEDIGLHYLAWLSQTLGIPYVT